MAKKVLRNRKQFTTTLDVNLIDDLKNISEETGIPISKLLDRAIGLLIKDINEKGIYNPVSHEK